MSSAGYIEPTLSAGPRMECDSQFLELCGRKKRDQEGGKKCTLHNIGGILVSLNDQWSVDPVYQGLENISEACHVCQVKVDT